MLILEDYFLHLLFNHRIIISTVFHSPQMRNNLYGLAEGDSYVPHLQTVPKLVFHLLLPFLHSETLEEFFLASVMKIN